MGKQLSVTIVGTGSVATALGLALSKKRIPIAAVIGHTVAKAKRLGKTIGSRLTGTSPHLAAGSSLIIFAVPDLKLESIAKPFWSVHFDRRKVVFGHTSGSLPATAFGRPASAEFRVSVISMHPLQTFVGRDAAPRLEGVTLGIEGEAFGLRLARKLAQRAGFRPVALQPSDKLAYHIAAIFQSNFLVGLSHAAEELYGSIRIPQKAIRTMIAPLATQTIHNVIRLGPTAALTGPAKRGDTETIRKHVEFLKRHHSTIAPLYEQLTAYCQLMSKKDT